MSFAGMAFGATPLTRARLTSLIKECGNYEGAEVVRLGGFTTGALKGLVWIAGSGDPDAKEFLRLCRGIKSMSIMEFDDCSPSDRAYINDRIERLLDESDVLMDVKEDGQNLRIYGVFDEKKNTVGDFVLYSKDECALICLFGKVSMDTLSDLSK